MPRFQKKPRACSTSPFRPQRHQEQPLSPYDTPGSPRSSKKRILRDTVCQNCGCGRDETNMWRTNRDPPRLVAEDNMLCNACGLWRNEHGNQRPREWWIKRGSSSPQPDHSSSSASPRPTAAVKSERKSKRRTKAAVSPAVKVPSKNSRRRDECSGDDVEEGRVKDAAIALLEFRESREPSSLATSTPSPVTPPTPRALVISPSYGRPAWLFNKEPAPVVPIPPPGGFIPTRIVTPALRNLLNSPPAVQESLKATSTTPPTIK
ncbi:uncharacterized protein IL334_000548 [Kwoniella shivajii]|uniref:GATA-type domain-containing protein n=1 Tax=Kwoniella shivajii TaxID=564305 RepID=A0ABZ1CPE7_9TREE|nr:hypothetical protein IL334_000548 [Kwoniella shivajii]